MMSYLPPYLPTYLPTYRSKRFSDFSQNFVRWGSSEIKLFNFGKFRIPIFPIGKKSDFVSNFRNFWSKSPLVGVTFFVKIDVAQNFLRCSSSDINLSYFWIFRFPIFPIGKKSDFVSNFRNFWSKSQFLGVIFLVKIRISRRHLFFQNHNFKEVQNSHFKEATRSSLARAVASLARAVR